MKRSALADLKVILDQLIGNENVLSNNVLFIDFTGSHEKAQLLSQMWYWSGKTKDKHGWFFKTYKEWYDEIRVPEHSVRRFVDAFKSAGFVATCFKKVAGRPVIHYRLDKDVLIQKLVTFCEGNNLLGSHSVTLDPDNLQPSKEPDNLQGSIYTETTLKGLQTDNSIVVFDENDPTYIVTTVSIERPVEEVTPPAAPTPAAEIVAYLNAATGRDFRYKTKPTQQAINARLADGYSIDDFKMVIDCKALQWKDDAEMSKYLRPETLFRPAHFESYLQEAKHRPAVNADAHLKDLPELTTKQADQYMKFVLYISEHYPALWRSGCRVFSQKEYFDYLNNTSLPGLSYNLSAKEKRSILTRLMQALSASDTKRKKWATVWSAYIETMRQILNGLKPTEI